MKDLIFFCCLLMFPIFGMTQGCSDAGFCTMGAMKPDQPYSNKIELKLRSMEMSFYRGTTSLTPVIYVATADLNFSINQKNTFQVKVPYQGITGRLANTSGMGDLSICFTRNLYTSDQFDLNLSLGGKIPSNDSDKATQSGLPLPMYYQTSLGTYDIISGLSLINRKWLLATGIQVPTNKNHNQFVWSAWNGSDADLKAYVDKYHQAKDLKRGVDVMLRVERNFRFSKFNFTTGLLPIYRIKRDEFTRSVKPAGSPEERITNNKDTQGLACSVLFTTGYNFNVRTGIKLLLGHKIVQRKTNPDGLTREFVSSFTYFYRF